MAIGDATTAQPNSPVDWSAILGSLASGGLDIYNLVSGKPQQTASTAANIANPLIPAQPQALSQLQKFLTDPSSVLQDPAFQAAEQLGAENISRQAGAAGMASSGNRLADLFKFGQTAGLGYEQQRFNQLMDVLRPSPQAAQIYLGGQGAKQGSVADLIHQILGGAGGSVGLLPAIIKMLTGGGASGGADLSTLLSQGGIDMAGLDAGGTLGDLASTTTPDTGLLDNFFTGGSGDVFQMIDVLGG